MLSMMTAVNVHVPTFPAASDVLIVMGVFAEIVVPCGGVCVKVNCAVAVQLSEAAESPT